MPLAANPIWQAVCGSPEPDSTVHFTFGKITAVSGRCFTLKEYDFARDTDVENRYQLLPDTTTGYISAERPLQIGDNVVLEYLEKDGQRLVNTLIREETDATG